MQLILAIDSDPRRSEQLANLVRSRLQVDLVQATSAGEGLHALRERVPDLILTSPLLSPFDDGVLDEYLRDLGAAATHVQTLRIPMLSTGPKKKSAANRIFALGRKKAPSTSSAAPDGCDPKVFADEIAHYLTRSLEERSASNRTEPARPAPSWLEETAPEPVAQPVDAAFARGASAPEDWGAPEALVQEFREAEPATPEPAFEQTHVPGSILDLRSAPTKPRGGGGTPIVHAPQPRVVEPEPVFVEPERFGFVEPQPASIFEPERPFDVGRHRSARIEPEPPTYVEPEPPAYVEPEQSTYVEPERHTYVEPVRPEYVEPERFDRLESGPLAYLKEQMRPVSREPEDPVHITPAAIKTPVTHTAPPASPAATASGNSASFEAALAAIRAAWAQPEPKASAPAAPESSASGSRPLPRSSDVDPTNAVDALDDVTTHQKAEKPRKRPENVRGRKTQGADGRDDWGVIDLSQYELNNR